MVISKLVRTNKRFIKQNNHNEIRPLKVRNQPAPTQDRIRYYIKENPNCIISDIYRAFPNNDQAYIRKCIRNMVEGHYIRQRFTVD